MVCGYAGPPAVVGSHLKPYGREERSPRRPRKLASVSGLERTAFTCSLMVIAWVRTILSCGFTAHLLAGGGVAPGQGEVLGGGVQAAVPEHPGYRLDGRPVVVGPLHSQTASRHDGACWDWGLRAHDMAG